MSKSAPIVAGINRPETPQETADRKAEASAVYRSSQNFRNLIAALLVTLGVVIVIVIGVPRGEPAAQPGIDLDAVAADVAKTMQSDVIVPDVEDGWQVNAAELTNDVPPVWDVTMAPQGEDARGFVHVAQAFDAEASWAPQVLGGTASTDTTTIDAREWDVYDIADAEDNANVSYALGTQAGDDYVLIYGSLGADATADLASDLSPQLDDLEEQQ